MASLLVPEAMKMEQALLAPRDGIAAAPTAIAVGQVGEGVALARIAREQG